MALSCVAVSCVLNVMPNCRCKYSTHHISVSPKSVAICCFMDKHNRGDSAESFLQSRPAALPEGLEPPQQMGVLRGQRHLR
jgi:hypothetical protein